MEQPMEMLMGKYAGAAWNKAEVETKHTHKRQTFLNLTKLNNNVSVLKNTDYDYS